MAEKVQLVRRALDYDRGVIINHNDKLGMDVLMYVDEPGIYYSAHGRAVSDDIAQSAGYDTVTLAKKKLLNERKAAAMAAIDKEFREEKDERPAEEVIKEDDGLKIVNIGLGRHFVKDDEGNNLHQKALTLEEAERTFASILKTKKR